MVKDTLYLQYSYVQYSYVSYVHIEVIVSAPVIYLILAIQEATF